MRARALALLLVAACEGSEASPADEPGRVAPPDPVAIALEPVRARERALRGQPRPPWSSVAGPDPVDVRAWGDGYLGLLRGASALVRLDASGQELDRIAAPEGAVGWVRDGERLHVVGEREAVIAVVRVDEQGFTHERSVDVDEVHGLRAVALDPERGGWVVADRHRGRVLRVGPEGSVDAELPCGGALDVQRHEGWLIANCMLEHRVQVLDASSWAPVASVTHDGPIWAVAPRSTDEGLELALAGVEDHPLDRTDGAFGYIDSFVYRVRLQDGTLQRLDAINVGEQGVVTPKRLRWRDDALWVTGAGADTMARIDFAGPTLAVRGVPAGLTGFAWQGEAMLAADPLLDRWVALDPGGGWTLAAIEADDSRTEAERVGEALVFTTLMAPQATAEGRGSRFTCETCHFEGTVDGRVHFTGRGEVYASTKTLRGLVGNQPHFSRALDRTTTGMIHNEFRVANANTPQDPWFDLDVADVPWLGALTTRGHYPPEALRGAVLEFLAAFTPERNPATLGRGSFSALEREGARRFEAACEGCHQARTVADDASTRLPMAAWEAAIFEDGRVLWASDDRYRTGVEPYVHEDGPRVPSLRRLWVKRPYLTQGTAPDLDAVLAAVRSGTDDVHAGTSGAPLSTDERRALTAFLDLL